MAECSPGPKEKPPAKVPRGDTGDLYRCPECKRLGGAHSSKCALGKAEARRG